MLCYQFGGANHTLWTGTKTSGAHPTGTYTRTGGCDTTATMTIA